MKNHKKLSKTERLEIGILKDKSYSIRAIAKAMNRSPSTISRELERNKMKLSGEYEPNKAHLKSYTRNKYKKFEWKKINENNELRKYITDKLKLHWNPKEISGRMKLEKQPFYVSKNTIYKWLYSTQGIPYCKYLYSKRYTRKKRIKKTARVLIPNRIGIETRLAGANNRTRYKHYECDTVVSGKSGKGAISVLIDRKSRYIKLNKLESLKPSEHLIVLQKEVTNLDIKSITFDNGIENQYHKELNIPTYFCNPYSSWEKGSVENVNKMIRKFIPKGTDISKVSKEYIQYVEDTINKKPRAILGFKSSYDIFNCINSGVAIGGGI